MDELFCCRIELAQHIVPSGRAKAFAQVLEPFQGHVMRLVDGRVYVDVVVPGRSLGEAVAQSILLVTYASRCADLPGRPLGVVAQPLAAEAGASRPPIAAGTAEVGAPARLA